MFGRTNAILRGTICLLRDESNWNPGGSYIQGKHCIVTGAFKAAVFDSDPIRNHHPALRVVRNVIENRFGLSRGSRWNRYKGRDEADIIDFNDHPRTTHADVMWVLTQAEKRTRPFWRKPMEAA